MEIGFVGLGDMGAGIASRLIDRGHRLSVYARRAEALAPFVARGAVARSSPAELAAGCELLCTCLPGPDSLQAVAMGPGGLMEGVQRGQTFIGFETNSPALVRQLAAALEEKGAAMLDAPVSGGATAAKSGALAIWVGGPDEALAKAMPVFEDIGDRVIHMGSSGAGCTAKILHQIVFYAAVEAISEARDIAAAEGLSPDRLAAVLRDGAFARTLLIPPVYPRFFEEPFKWSKLGSDIARKDQFLGVELARRHGIDAPLAELVEDHMAASGLRLSC